MSEREGHSEPSETSPLISQDTSSTNTAAQFVQAGESTSRHLPRTSGSNGETGDNGKHAHGNGIAKSDDDDEALERQASRGSDREAQYQGMPEVRKQLKYILPALSIGIFLAAADQSLVASSAGKIGSDLNALNNTSWIATAYFLTLTSFQPLYGKLSDIFGRKACLLSAYTIFAFGCLWCGLSRSMNEFIAARALSGVGGGGMTTVVSIMMSDIIPLRERGTWQGLINIIFATGAGVGAPLGGALSDSIGWKWAFMGQFPLCALAFLSVALLLKLPKNDSGDAWKTKLRRIDFPGAFVLVSAVTTLLIGLDRGSNYSWSAPVTIVCLAISVPLFIAFIFVEQKVAAEPFAPGRIIFERSLFAAYLCNFWSFASWFGCIFYLPLYFQAVPGLSATQSGIRLLPGVIFGVTGSLLGGLIMQKTGKYYWLTVGAYTLLTLAGVPILLFSTAEMYSEAGILIGLAMGGFGNGTGVTTSLIALISNASPKDQAIATACSYLFRSLGSVVGLSLQAALFQFLLRIRLEERLNGGDQDASELIMKIRESLDYVKTLEPQVQQIVREAYGKASSGVFVLIIAMAAGSMISSFFIREKKLGR